MTAEEISKQTEELSLIIQDRIGRAVQITNDQESYIDITIESLATSQSSIEQSQESLTTIETTVTSVMNRTESIVNPTSLLEKLVKIVAEALQSPVFQKLVLAGGLVV